MTDTHDYDPDDEADATLTKAEADIFDDSDGPAVVDPNVEPGSLTDLTNGDTVEIVARVRLVPAEQAGACVLCEPHHGRVWGQWRLESKHGDVLAYCCETCLRDKEIDPRLVL